MFLILMNQKSVICTQFNNDKTIAMAQYDETIFGDLKKTRNRSYPFQKIINMSVGFFGIQFGWDLQKGQYGGVFTKI